MANKGFLLVFMHPPAECEEEFNAWYDTEHIPERLSVPGILTGLRASYEGRPDVNQVRVLVQDNGAAGQDVMGFVEARAPLPDGVDARAFGSAAAAIDLVAQYAAF